MNLLGKIITLMILLLSVCFLMIAIMVSASHDHWKERALANKDRVEELQRNRTAILDEVQKKEQRLKTEMVARMMRLGQLESQVQMALANYEAKEKELADSLVISQQRLALATRAAERLTEQDKEVEDLKNQTSVLTQDVADKRLKVAERTNQIYELEGARRALDAMLRNLAADNALLTKVLKANGLEKTDLTALLEPKVDGRVVAVSKDMIHVDLGLDDGLKKGHSIDLYRDGKYVGAAVITLAEHNRSVATIDRDLTKYAIEQGDLVSTQWVRNQK